MDNPHRGCFAPYRGPVANVLPPVARVAGAPSPAALLERQAAELLSYVPDVGDPRVQRAVDSLVEQAGDTLLALADTAQAARDARVASAPTRTRPPTRAPKPSAAAADPSDAAAADLPRTTPDHGLGVLGGRPLRVLRDDTAPWEPQ